MIYLKEYYDFLFEKNTELILYHGSPKTFKEFKNSTTFFSRTEDFAMNYPRTKDSLVSETL